LIPVDIAVTIKMIFFVYFVSLQEHLVLLYFPDQNLRVIFVSAFQISGLLSKVTSIN